ncbi:MAG: hypothetical protein ACI9FR_002576 [Cryomorphaceae bacterium]|jgi:uncharacterized protein (TIGR02118 family)
MVKMIFCVKKRGDISAEHFNDYWLNHHGPLVKSHREALQIKRYSQKHSGYFDFAEFAIEQRDMSSSYDGFAELWWPDIETAMAAFSSEKGQAASAALAEDEARFIDLSKSTIAFTDEYVIFE